LLMIRLITSNFNFSPANSSIALCLVDLHTAIYIESHPGSIATIHQEMAGLTQFFDWIIEKRHFAKSPCHPVKRPRQSYPEGKTPALNGEKMVNGYNLDPQKLFQTRDLLF
ncbi:MAG: hypothetical protein ACPGVO_21445, partial [Spirulinaceae cyanobacterium]